MTTTITTYHEPIITSLDIAEITGKNHKDIMRVIRNSHSMVTPSARTALRL